MLLGMGGVWLLVGNYCALRDREQLRAVAALLNSVLEKYPETSEEELVAILNGKAESDRGERLLGQYGMFLNREGIDISSNPAAAAGRTVSLGRCVFLCIDTGFGILFQAQAAWD